MSERLIVIIDNKVEKRGYQPNNLVQKKPLEQSKKLTLNTLN